MTVAYRWNADGGIVEERSTSSNDGLRVIALECADGRAVSGEEDRDGDGTLDARRHYGYDDADHLVLREVDGDFDGVYERSVAWEIDERGPDTSYRGESPRRRVASRLRLGAAGAACPSACRRC